MNLVTGKTEAGSQHQSEAPHPPTKEVAILAKQGRKSKHKATRRSGTVHSLQKRLSGRQKKEKDLIQSPSELRHHVPVLPPCCKPLERGVSELKR